MKTVNIEINLQKGYSSRYTASYKQINYIQKLMLQRGMDKEYRGNFMKNGKVVYNSITKVSASKLIKALKSKQIQIRFNRFITTPTDLPEPIIRKLYEPIPPKKDVHRISIEEQRALEQKYIKEL